MKRIKLPPQKNNRTFVKLRGVKGLVETVADEGLEWERELKAKLWHGFYGGLKNEDDD